MLNISDYHVILASKSPRRQQLLQGMDIAFEVMTKDVDESFELSHGLSPEQIALMLAERKALAFSPKELPDNFLLITADTIVVIDGEILNKPAGKPEAISMIGKLSGRQHRVITAVCLKTRRQMNSFFEFSDVMFASLTEREIAWYVEKYAPFDKAGAYGIQEWIGYVGIASVTGSFFNVMGLPTHRLYEELKMFEKNKAQ